MNFQDLLSKMKQLDEEVVAPADAAAEIPPTAAVEECGMDMMPPVRPMPAPKQSDSLTMNVSMNGSGAGGIRDLMNILKDIQGDAPAEPHADHDHGEPLFGDEIEKESAGGFDSATTKPNEVTLDIDSVLSTGDDMHSKGGEAEKVNGGGNPFNVDESLVTRLSQHYESIKEGKKDGFDPLKHVKNPTKGEKEAAKDVKRGSYADRAAMLKSAEADGRLKEGNKQTMSRAAKGNEKYGKDGMKALAKAGRDGASEEKLDAIRDKHDNYNESINESADILALSKMLNG